MTEPGALCLGLIGGRLEADNRAVFAGLRRRCRGRMEVLATASLMPEEVGPDTVADLARHRIDADLLPLTWDNHIEAAYDPAVVARLDAAGGVYFTGGDQSHLIQALRRHGEESPVLQAIRRLALRGGLVSGSSAGAAVMSALSILGGTSLEAMVYGVASRSEDPGLLLGPGLGFFPYGLVDQHFLQRGRIGRLLVAVAAIGQRFGFGVDENTCLFVDGTHGEVVGEKGVLVLDADHARFDIAHRHYDGFRVSYLDDGDGWDFAAQRPRPKASRKPVKRPRRFEGPGYLQRSVFGPYAFDELMTRLAAGDPRHYRRDHAVAYEPDAQVEITLEVERAAEPASTLRARRGRGNRYTLLDYGLEVRSRPLSPAQHREWVARHGKQLMRGREVAADSLVIAIGAALRADNTALLDTLRGLKREISVVAAASAAARDVAAEYVALLHGHGIAARAFDAREDDALEVLAVAPAILFTGGNQDRLRQALFSLGEESPLLQASLASYRAGGALIAVGGSANALSSAMIAGGSSEEAIRFGASPDPWYRGVVLQEGLGLLREGLIDQYFVGRNRLARLLVACVEEGCRWGFGLAEDSGLLRRGGGHRVQAIGAQGFACLDLHRAVVHAHDHGFDALQVVLRWVGPGQVIDTGSGELSGTPAATTPLGEIVARFIDELGELDGDTRCRVGELQADAQQARFNIEIQRAPEGRRALPELDHRRRPRR